MRPQPQQDHAGEEDGLDLPLDTGDQILTTHQRVGDEQEQEGIGRHVVPGLPKVAELHGQGKQDEVQEAKPDERGVGRARSGRFGADRL